MTRIIAGDAGSVRLVAPAKVSRPTSDRVREAIFSRLESLGEVAGATVLDLFAGTGALGLEAASRGASVVWLVDNNAGATKVQSSNIAVVMKPLSHSPTIRSVTANVAAFLARPAPSPQSIVFLDPPYDYSPRVLDEHLVALRPWLAPDALVVVERSSKGTPPEFPEGFEVLSPKEYGDTTVYWARFLNGSQPPA